MGVILHAGSSYTGVHTVYKIHYDYISHADVTKIFDNETHTFSKFTFADLTTQSRIVWLFNHASSTA
jgi:hypothetical protein